MSHPRGAMHDPILRRKAIHASVRAMWIEDALEGYLRCALWSSYTTDEDGAPKSFDDHVIEDFDPDFVDESRTEIIAISATALSEQILVKPWSVDGGQFGHDFWLTRNHHGAGFWDRGAGDAGKRLTELAHSYGDVNLHIIDGKVYAE